MSAARDIIAQVRAAGGRVMITEDRLKVRAPLPLSDRLVAKLTLHKAEVMTFLQDRKAAWTQEDWRAYFEERAGIAEHNGHLSRADAGRAYECCVVQWMNLNPPPENGPERCIECGEPIAGNDELPVLTGDGGHIWMHTGCHSAWMAQRRAEAMQSLAVLGVCSEHKTP